MWAIRLASLVALSCLLLLSVACKSENKGDKAEPTAVAGGASDNGSSTSSGRQSLEAQATPSPPGPATVVGTNGGKAPASEVNMRAGTTSVPSTLPGGPGLGAGTEAAAVTSGAASTAPDGAIFAGGVGADRANAGNQVYFLDNRTGEWKYLQMTSARISHTVTDLGDGSALIAGGLNGRDIPPLASAELYRGGAIGETGSLREARSYHAAVKLARGRALIVGGTGSGASLAGAEVYDAAAGQFSPAGQLTEARMGPSATLLDDGRVLIAGGNGSRTAEVYDPQARSFSRVGDMTAIHGAGHIAVKLASGEVLIAGGWDANLQPIATAELFDPRTNAFRFSGNMTAPRREHAAVLLPDGTVLISGGYTNESVTASAELFDPRAGSFSKASDLPLAAAEHAMVVLWGGADLTAPRDQVIQIGMRSQFSPEFYADVLRVELKGGEIRVQISARGTADLREPQTSCLFEEGAAQNASIKAQRFVSSVSEAGRRYEGDVVFDRSSLQPGRRYFFRYSCQLDYSAVFLGSLR